MKQKLFTLLTLLLCVCTGAWANSEWVMKDWSTGHTGLTYWASGASADIPSTSTDKNTPAWSDESDYNTYTGTGGSSNFQLDSKTSTWKSEHPNRVWSFDVNANDVIKVYFMGGGSGNRSMYVSYNASTTNRDTETAFASATADGYTPTILTGTATKAGTVYLWCDNNVRVYAIKLTTGTSAKAYTVTAATNNENYGTAAAVASSLDESETTTITATPKTGYAFTSWAVAGEGSSLSSTTTNPTTLTMGTANATVTATFSAINYTVTHNAATGGTYTISVAGGEATDANTTATIGQTITLAGTPTDPAHTAIAWNVKDAGDNDVTVTNNQFTMPASNVTIAPVFSEPVALNTFFSMTNITGAGGTISKGTTASVTATFSEGGSAEVYQNASNGDMYYNGSINLNGSGSSYLHVTFPSPLQIGDVITATFLAEGQAWKLSKTTSGAASKTNPYTIVENDALLGATDLYIFKDGSAQISELTIKGEGNISDLTITSSKTPTIEVGATTTIEKTSSSNGEYTFTSSDASVATVSSDGVITAVGGGTATITINQAADGTYRVGMTKVTVTVPEHAIIKAKLNGTSDATVTGAIDGVTAENSGIENGGNKFGSGAYVTLILPAGYTFQTGDILNVNITENASGGGSIKVYDPANKDEDHVWYDTETKGSVGDNKFVLPSTVNGKQSISICRTSSNGWNAKVAYIAVYRPEKVTLSNTTGFNYGFCGFCGSANFTVENGAAYQASLAENAIKLTKIEGVVPANEGVIIVGEKDATATINYTNEASTADMSNNILEGTTARTLTETLKGNYDKLLTLQKSTSKFIEYTGEYFPANRAYFTTNTTLSGKAMSFDIMFADATSVKNIEAVTTTNEARAVKKAIVNGRLVIMTENGYVNVLGQTVK